MSYILLCEEEIEATREKVRLAHTVLRLGRPIERIVAKYSLLFDMKFILIALIIAATAPFIAASTPSSSADVAKSLLDAFSSSLSNSNSSMNEKSPLVQAASGLADSLLSGNASIASFKSQLEDLKKSYDDARAYLKADDAVRIGGYLLTLDNLALSSFAAFPVAQTTLLVTQLALGSAITSLVGGILQTISSSLALAASIIFLQLSLQAAYPNGQPPGPHSNGQVHNSRSYSDSFAQEAAMLNVLMANADQIDAQLLPFFFSGGMSYPISLAQDVLTSSASSLDRLVSFTPQMPLNQLNFANYQVRAGPFVEAFSGGSTGFAFGSVAAAAANLAGLGGR